ncbi:MAG: alpha/beta hydrolase [Deltaproteobacteria bacterium]|nr:alpha/beta hydrolase [Deltaproteobacteria bacterium]
MKLIFIHGSGGSKESWHYQTHHFANAEALDLPGHPAGEPCSSIDDYVKWLRGYIHEQGYRDVVLAGHSLGGGIALLYALKYPEDLKGIISVGSGARLRVHPMYLEMLEKAVEDPSILDDEPNPVYDLIEPELAKILKQRAKENGPAVTLNDMRACDRFDIMDQIGKIKLPVLALCGDQDIMTPPKYSYYLADHIPKATAVVIPGGTHMVFAEKPEEVNQAIEAFLSQI